MAPPKPVWFITGASSGFGNQIALFALERGHTVVATARNASRIQALADAGADTISFDVTSPLADIEATAANVISKHGRVDYLINSAGYILDGAVEEVTPQEAQDTFNTNVFGTTNTIRSFLPHMRKQELGANGLRGTVVTFGSIGSWRGGATYAYYSMTKACMSSLAESLKDELEPFQIAATVVEPGYFRTSFLNPGVRVNSATRLEAYEDPATATGKVRRALTATDGNQPGDVNKGCRVIVDILTKSGASQGRDIPVRIVLGTDADAVIRGKCETSIGLLDEWKDTIMSTDYPKGE
jgi:NAD(P)-dependent dehydrogenase (short-subunit alcohol dehydrogenase family)